MIIKSLRFLLKRSRHLRDPLRSYVSRLIPAGTETAPPLSGWKGSAFRLGTHLLGRWSCEDAPNPSPALGAWKQEPLGRGELSLSPAPAPAGLAFPPPPAAGPAPAAAGRSVQVCGAGLALRGARDSLGAGRGRAGRSGRRRHRPGGLRGGGSSRGRVTPLLAAGSQDPPPPPPPRSARGPSGSGPPPPAAAFDAPPRRGAAPARSAGRRAGGRPGRPPPRGRQRGRSGPARPSPSGGRRGRGGEGEGGSPGGGRGRRGGARDPHLAGAAAPRPGSRRARRLGARRPLLGARTHTLRRCGPASGAATTPLPAPGGATAPSRLPHWGGGGRQPAPGCYSDRRGPGPLRSPQPRPSRLGRGEPCASGPPSPPPVPPRAGPARPLRPRSAHRRKGARPGRRAALPGSPAPSLLPFPGALAWGGGRPRWPRGLSGRDEAAVSCRASAPFGPSALCLAGGAPSPGSADRRGGGGHRGESAAPAGKCSSSSSDGATAFFGFLAVLGLNLAIRDTCAGSGCHSAPRRTRKSSQTLWIARSPLNAVSVVAPPCNLNSVFSVKKTKILIG